MKYNLVIFTYYGHISLNTFIMVLVLWVVFIFVSDFRNHI